MKNLNVQEIMTSIPDHFLPENAKGISAIVQFVLTGDQASNWVINIHDQVCSVDEGIAENPDLTIKGDTNLGLNIFTGKTNAMQAFLLGKVKIKGDKALGMKLAKMFHR